MDNNNALSHDEFKNCVLKIKGNISDSEVNRMFESIDKDSNGKVTLDGNLLKFLSIFFLIKLFFYKLKSLLKE